MYKGALCRRLIVETNSFNISNGKFRNAFVPFKEGHRFSRGNSFSVSYTLGSFKDTNAGATFDTSWYAIIWMFAC
jgi:hypothetical protein